MKAKLGSTKGFRPWPENQERLDYAEKLGLTMSEIINPILKEHLRDYLVKVKDTKAKELSEALNAPVP